jgi:hypothetical protein
MAWGGCEGLDHSRQLARIGHGSQSQEELCRLWNDCGPSVIRVGTLQPRRTSMGRIALPTIVVIALIVIAVMFFF